MSAPESPSALLHRAASLMRERAEAAPEAPWSARFLAASRSGVHAVAERHFVMAGETNIAITDEAGAEYIAGMHPLVALALADLLEAEGERAAQIDAYQGTPVYLAMLAGYRLPLAVARAFLAEPEPEGAKP